MEESESYYDFNNPESDGQERPEGSTEVARITNDRGFRREVGKVMARRSRRELGEYPHQ